MKGLNISCQQATQLVDKKNEKGLNLWERFQLKFHNWMCGLCHRYQKQSKLMDDLIQERILKSEKYKINSMATDALKIKIKNQINSQ